MPNRDGTGPRMAGNHESNGRGRGRQNLRQEGMTTPAHAGGKRGCRRGGGNGFASGGHGNRFVFRATGLTGRERGYGQRACGHPGDTADRPALERRRQELEDALQAVRQKRETLPDNPQPAPEKQAQFSSDVFDKGRI